MLKIRYYINTLTILLSTPSEETLISDGSAVVVWAKKRFEHVGIFGVSLGSGVAVGVAARGAPVDVVALGTPYDRMDKVGADHMPWAWPELLMEDRFISAERIQKITQPLFVLAAAQDEVISPARTQALKSAARGRGSWSVLPGGHGTMWKDPRACAWLRKVSALR